MLPEKTRLIKRFPSLRNLLLNARVKRRLPIVRQLAATDCGAAALATVLRYHGKEVTLDAIRSALNIGRGGVSAAALLRVGTSYGLRGRGVSVDTEAINALPTAAILFWEFRHFVVLERVGKHDVQIVDPSSGRRSVPLKRFQRSFTGVALLFEPSAAFERGGSKKARVAGLVRQVAAHRDLLGRIIAVSVFAQLLSLVMPLFTGILIDRVVPRKDYSMLAVLAAGYAVFQCFNVVTGFVRSHLFIHLRTEMESSFTLRFLDHLVSLPYSYFQQHTSGDLMVRLGSNNSIRDILTSSALSAFLDGTMASVYLVLLLLASPVLTGMVVLFAAMRFALLAVIRWRQRLFLAESLENQARSQTYLVEMLAGMETLKAMGIEHRAAESWANVFVDGLNISIRRGRLDALFNILLSGLGLVSNLSLTFYGAFLVLNDTFSLGMMMAFNALASGFLGPLNSLLSAGLQLQMLEVYLERLNDVMDTPAEQEPGCSSIARRLSGALSLEKVSFRYNLSEPLVLDCVSLSVGAGAKIAVVGRTGSGKSTMARLMAGLYHPTAGRLLYDGVDLASLDRASVRSQLGIVTQETQLFSGSIRRNIALSEPEMSLDRVVMAAKSACIHDEISAMPMGYETSLADRGMSLSGGQRQRLAIARAIASNPAVLLLDEATSHLDAVTEEQVNTNLSALQCTRVVIAHRLSTIRDADLIVVMDHGRIQELGRHEILVRANGPYAELIHAQWSQTATPTAPNTSFPNNPSLPNPVALGTETAIVEARIHNDERMESTSSARTPSD